MSAENGFRVNFLLGTNLPVSVTRLTADAASWMVRAGIRTTVIFPAVDWWEYKLFRMRQARGPAALAQALRLAGEVLLEVPLQRRWCGLRVFDVDPRVVLKRFALRPAISDLQEGVTVVQHTYVLGETFRRDPRSHVKMVGALHVNLEKAIQSPSIETAAWFRHWLELERRLPMPRFATSEDSRRAAERLGIPVQRVIHGGIDLKLFCPAERRAGQGLLTVSLYCDPNRQKGREVGVEAFARLKGSVPGLRLCSIGHVTREQGRIFDVNRGYLIGADYARALQETDIFVYPSLYDGFPAPPLQGMSCGAALVSSRVEGVLEYARDGENCLLTEPGNAGMIAEQVVGLAHDAALRERIRRGGLETAQRFSVERSASELLRFLREIYEKNPQRELVHAVRAP